MNPDNPSFRTPEEERRAQAFVQSQAENVELKKRIVELEAENRKLKSTLEILKQATEHEIKRLKEGKK